MKFSDPHLNKDCLPYSQDNLSASKHADPSTTKETKNPTMGPVPLKPLASHTPPPDPFRTPTEEFLDTIDQGLDNGTLSPGTAHWMRLLFQSHLLEVSKGLPHGTISPLPDPDTALPDAANETSPLDPTTPPGAPLIIDLITPPAPTTALEGPTALIIDLTTPPAPKEFNAQNQAFNEPAKAPSPSPTPQWTRRGRSPETEELAKACGTTIHKFKGYQAVQGASPAHDTEASLEPIPTHAPGPSGMFGMYTLPTTSLISPIKGPPKAYTPEAEGPFPSSNPAPLEFSSISPPKHTDTAISNNLPANRESLTLEAPSPLQSWHTLEKDHPEPEKVAPKEKGKPSSPYMNEQRQQYMQSWAEEVSPPPPRRQRKPTKTLSGANETRYRKNGLMSRHTHITKHSPRTHTNAIPLSTRGSPSPEWEGIDSQQRNALYELIDQLEWENLKRQQEKENWRLSEGRKTIINQEADHMKAALLHWACFGPSGQDIPQDIPLTSFQVNILNERIRKELAYRGLPMITPIPRPPPPSSNIPPLHPSRPSTAYYPTTGTFDKARAPPEKSDWLPPSLTPPPTQQATTTRRNTTIARPDTNPLFTREFTHTSELPPSYPNEKTTSSTAYVHNVERPPKGYAWKAAFIKHFNNASSRLLNLHLRIKLENVSYAPHYPDMLCLRISHT